MIAVAEKLGQLLSGFKSEKKPVIPTLSSCQNAIFFGEKPYRCVLFEIRSDSNLTPTQKRALIDGLRKYYDLTSEWERKNGEVVLRGQDKASQT